MTVSNWLVVSLLAITLLNLMSAWITAKAPAFNWTQKPLQTALIWLLPILGAKVLCCCGFCYRIVASYGYASYAQGKPSRLGIGGGGGGD